jgi:predicted PolB exonuclease-like 3'-5' exonuclease
VGERTEKELITAFCDKIAELSPQLVTFNGNSFDLPVLRYRAIDGKSGYCRGGAADRTTSMGADQLFDVRADGADTSQIFQAG